MIAACCEGHITHRIYIVYSVSAQPCPIIYNYALHIYLPAKIYDYYLYLAPDSSTHIGACSSAAIYDSVPVPVNNWPSSVWSLGLFLELPPSTGQSTSPHLPVVQISFSMLNFEWSLWEWGRWWGKVGVSIGVGSTITLLCSMQDHRLRCHLWISGRVRLISHSMKLGQNHACKVILWCV